MQRRLTGVPAHFLGSNPLLPDDGGAGGEEGGGGAPPKTEAPAWTPPASQADLDRIITERLAREKAKFADYDDLKRKAAEHDKAAEAAKTEHEKAVEAARKEGMTEALKVANSRLVSAEARALAAEAQFQDPGDAVRLLDLSDVTVADDGTVDTEGIKTALAELAKTKPYLIRDSGPKPPPTFGGGPRKTETPDPGPGVNRLRAAYAQTSK